VLGRSVDWETAAQAFIHAFESELGLIFEEGEVSASESARAGELVQEKYAHPSWTERA
jgi:lipoate-protein ligase A